MYVYGCLLFLFLHTQLIPDPIKSSNDVAKTSERRKTRPTPILLSRQRKSCCGRRRLLINKLFERPFLDGSQIFDLPMKSLERRWVFVIRPFVCLFADLYYYITWRHVGHMSHKIEGELTAMLLVFQNLYYYQNVLKIF